MDVRIIDYRCADGFGDFVDFKKLFKNREKDRHCEVRSNPKLCRSDL